MAKTVTKKQLAKRLTELSEAYGIQPPSMVASQIMDLSADLSEETLTNVYLLATTVSGEIGTLFRTYGSKPNVVVDSKVANAVRSFESKSPEMAILFLRVLSEQEQIVLKNPQSVIPDDLRELVEEAIKAFVK